MESIYHAWWNHVILMIHMELDFYSVRLSQHLKCYPTHAMMLLDVISKAISVSIEQ